MASLNPNRLYIQDQDLDSDLHPAAQLIPQSPSPLRPQMFAPQFLQFRPVRPLGGPCPEDSSITERMD